MIRVALLQLESGATTGDNLRSGLAACREARANGADIALLPEVWSHGYAFPDADDGAARRRGDGPRSATTRSSSAGTARLRPKAVSRSGSRTSRRTPRDRATPSCSSMAPARSCFDTRGAHLRLYQRATLYPGRGLQRRDPRDGQGAARGRGDDLLRPREPGKRANPRGQGGRAGAGSERVRARGAPDRSDEDRGLSRTRSRSR